MEYKCKNEKCGYVFFPHRYLCIKHPGKIRCPKCKSRCMRTERGTKEFKEMHYIKNLSEGARAGNLKCIEELQKLKDKSEKFIEKINSESN